MNWKIVASKISSGALALASLRGGAIGAMIFAANITTVEEMGEISAIYTIVTSGGQVVGFSLNCLALDLAKKINNRSIDEYTFTKVCLMSWIFISSIIMFFSLIFKDIFISYLFNDSLSPVLYDWGVVWLCGLALEVMAVGVAMAAGQMPAMAKAGLLQGCLMVLVTPLSILFFGQEGIASACLLSLTAGIALLSTMKPWRSERQWRHLVVEMIPRFKTIVGPSTLAAVFLTGLGVLLVKRALEEPGGVNIIAYFSVSMQIISVFAFFPQVLNNYFLSNVLRINDKLDIYKAIIKVSVIICIFCISIFAFICEFGNYLLDIYGNKYAGAYLTLVIGGIALVIQAALQVLTQSYLTEGRQWSLAVVCFVSTLVGYIFFIYESHPTSETMMSAVLVANVTRAILVCAQLMLFVRAANRSLADELL